MKPFIHMTGPHPSRIRRDGQSRPVWRVAVVAGHPDPASAVYRCLSYRRAVSLACCMAQDRRLFLHMEALPQ